MSDTRLPLPVTVTTTTVSWDARQVSQTGWTKLAKSLVFAR